MSQPAIEPRQADPESLRALVAKYIDYHAGIENYVVVFAVGYWLLRRLGIEPTSWPGRLAGGLIHLLMVLLPALFLAAVSGQWSQAPLHTWVIVATLWGSMAALATPLYRTSIRNLLSWLNTITDTADLRGLDAWQRRWFSHRVILPVSVLLTLIIVTPLIWMLRGTSVSGSAGMLYIGVFLFFTIVENACAVVMVPFEAHRLTTCRYELYRLSPADTPAMRQSLRGYSQLGAVNVIVVTLMVLLIVLLLPGDSRLVIPIVVSMLLIELVYTALGSLAPRIIMGRIIQRTKEEEMTVLQGRLDDLVQRIRELSEAEYLEMKRLQETHDAIRNSPENLLPLGALLRTAGALLLSTLTVLATAFAQEWIAGMTMRFVP